jgi:hypothetical protein
LSAFTDRPRLRFGGGGRQIDANIYRCQRRGHHKDDQQHQHDVDKRRHVDFMQFAAVVQIFI